MLPMVSFCGSLTSQLSKYLTAIVQPLTDKSLKTVRKLQSKANFIDDIKIVQKPGDYKVVYFDVNSLFTSIPLQLALHCSDTAIQQSTVKLPLPTEDIMDLLNLCLTSTYFQYNSKHYKQLHGTAMGLPVSVVVAEIPMQHMEEHALVTCDKQYHLGYAMLRTPLPPFTKRKLTLFMTTLTNRMPTSSLPNK